VLAVASAKAGMTAGSERMTGTTLAQLRESLRLAGHQAADHDHREELSLQAKSPAKDARRRLGEGGHDPRHRRPPLASALSCAPKDVHWLARIYRVIFPHV
jgi:hypothetical protein